MDGATHHGGPVSTKSAWIDPAALAITGGDAGGKSTARTEACIKAVRRFVIGLLNVPSSEPLDRGELGTSSQVKAP